MAAKQFDNIMLECACAVCLNNVKIGNGFWIGSIRSNWIKSNVCERDIYVRRLNGFSANVNNANGFSTIFPVFPIILLPSAHDLLCLMTYCIFENNFDTYPHTFITRMCNIESCGAETLRKPTHKFISHAQRKWFDLDFDFDWKSWHIFSLHSPYIYCRLMYSCLRSIHSVVKYVARRFRFSSLEIVKAVN